MEILEIISKNRHFAIFSIVSGRDLMKILKIISKNCDFAIFSIVSDCNLVEIPER